MSLPRTAGSSPGICGRPNGSAISHQSSSLRRSPLEPRLSTVRLRTDPGASSHVCGKRSVWHECRDCGHLWALPHAVGRRGVQ